MYKHYVQHTINRKRKFIYLEKKRWVYIIIYILMLFIGNYARYENVAYEIDVLECTSIVLSIFCSLFILFVAIPELLKKQKYYIFGLAIILSIIGTTGIESLICSLVLEHSETLKRYIFDSLIHNVTLFTNTIALAFILETIDDIALRKESLKDIKILQDAQLKLSRTHVDLQFMLSHLRDIKSDMQQNVANQDSSQHLLQLSEILRYKLYGHEKIMVPIEEEIEVLDKMIELKNHFLSQNDHQEIIWDYDVNSPNIPINKSILVNILTKLFDLCSSHEIKNKILYLLVEDQSCDFYIELDGASQDLFDSINKNLKSILDNHDVNYYQIDDVYEHSKATFNVIIQLWN